MDPLLRLYVPGDTAGDAGLAGPASTVGIALGDLVAAVAGRDETAAWVADFADDEIRVSPDLYDVLTLVRGRDRAA